MEQTKTIEETKIEEESMKGNFIQYLTFYLGKEIYGVEVSSVKEVIEFNKVFKIPRMPDHIKGVTNLRGEVIPVIDLSYMFYGHKSEITINTGIVFIEISYMNNIVLLGILIDKVESVTNIFEDNINSIQEFATKIKYEYISNIGKVDDTFIILLNINTILNIEELSKLNKHKENIQQMEDQT